MAGVVFLDSVRRVTGRRAARRTVRVNVRRPSSVGERPLAQPGVLRRTRPDLPLIDAVDGFSDFVHCPHPGCCALRPVDTGSRCAACGRI